MPSTSVRRLRPAALVLAFAVVACAPATGASFDPRGPCSGDGQRAGAYPELEAKLPARFEGRPPVRVDSGRNCTAARLGTLAGHGIRELRFAGATWETGRESGFTVARFEAPGLTMEQMAEFYESGAREARRTEIVGTATYDAGGVHGRRLDALVDDSYQTVVVLEGEAPGSVRAVLVGTDLGEAESRAAHDRLVAEVAELATSR